MEVNENPTTTYLAREAEADELCMAATAAMRTINVTRPANILRHYGLPAVLDGLFELRAALARGEAIRNRAGYFYRVAEKYHTLELPADTEWLKDFESSATLESMIRRQKYLPSWPTGNP